MRYIARPEALHPNPYLPQTPTPFNPQTLPAANPYTRLPPNPTCSRHAFRYTAGASGTDALSEGEVGPAASPLSYRSSNTSLADPLRAVGLVASRGEGEEDAAALASAA